MNLTRRLLLPILCLVFTALGACGDDAATGCLTNAECGADETCVNGECAPRGRRDAASADGRSVDAQNEDVEATGDAGPEADASQGTDAGPAVCGGECDTGNPCEVGAFECASGEPVCVAAGPAAEGTLCREVEGECDMAESCDGVSMECPANARVAADTPCRAAVDGCDIAELCDGTSPACPIDAFSPTGTSCAAGFCDGSGACSDSCTPNAACDPGVQCRVGRVDCSGGVPSCELAGNDVDGTTCRTAENGSWSACSFASTCAQSGTQTRNVTRFACGAGMCDALVTMESRSCTRSTEGAGCGSPSTGPWGACGGFDTPCDLSGTRSRTVSTPTCAGGGCNIVMTTQTETCTRTTNGNSCGVPSVGAWSSCGYMDACAESATRSRTVTTPTCNAGGCAGVDTTQTEACNRDTDGVTCGATTTGPYGSCRVSGRDCNQTGTQSRTVTARQCVAGSCSDVMSSESIGCSVNTNGNPCLGPPCGLNICSGGSCDQSPNCPSGQSCCGVGDTCVAFCP